MNIPKMQEVKSIEHGTINNSDRPAVPSSVWRFFSEINHDQCNIGLTKREHFAAMAMQGILSAGDKYNECGITFDSVARNAVKQADALLEELSK